MGKRKAEESRAEEREWEIRKDRITSLRMENSVAQVREILLKEDFERTINQYNTHLSKWKEGIPKNVKEIEWKYIFDRKKKRAAEGKASAVTVRGYPVPQSRIDKQSRKHTYQTTLQRYITEEEPATPPGVEVYTPRAQSPASPWFEPDTSFFYPTIQLPWQKFTGALNKMFDSTRPFPLPEAAVAMIRDSLRKAIEPGDRSKLALTGRRTGVGEAIRDINNSLNTTTPATEACILQRYLPTASDSMSLGVRGEDYDISIRGEQLQLLGSIIGLISNNHHSRSLCAAILRLADNDINLGFIHRFLSMKCLSIKIVVKKLLRYFCQYDGNPKLLEALLKSGNDSNYKFIDGSFLLTEAIRYKRPAVIKILLQAGADVDHDGGWGSPLLRACEEGDDEKVELLLDFGANFKDLDHSRIAVLSHAALHCKDAVVLRLLDLGAQHGAEIPELLGMIKNRSRNVAERLLKSLKTSPVQSPDIMVSFFIHAAWHGDIDALEFLVSTETATFGLLKKTPWLLLEAAACGVCGDFDAEGQETAEAKAIAVIDYLRAHDYHLRKLDKHGRGSPLVYAAMRGSVRLARHLIDSGARIDTFANGEWKNRCHASDHIIEDDYAEYLEDLMYWSELLKVIAEDQRKIAPIHAAAIQAVCGGDERAQVGLSITNLLLENGANPNLAGAVYAIQIAASGWHQNVALVKRLLEEGASPNLTTPNKINFYIPDDLCDGNIYFEVPMPNALHLALVHGSAGMIEALVDAKAKLPDLLDAVELCTCECNQVSLEETSQDECLHYGSSDERPFWSSWTQLSNSDNPNEKPLSADGLGNYMTEYHDPNRRECPYNYQFWWNPLYGVASENGKFAKALELCSSTQKMRWLTPEFTSKFIEWHGWESVINRIKDRTFPKSCVEDEAFFRTAILADEESWVRKLINRKGSSDPVVQRGFILATEYQRTSIIKMFLEARCWPDDKAWFCSEPFIDPERVYRSPLGQALEMKDSLLVSVFQDYYSTMCYAEDSDHILQAYGEAIEHGHLELAESLIGNGPVDIVKYSGPVPRDHSNDTSRLNHIWAKLRSSMQLAIIFHRKNVVDWLLDKGANLDIPAEEQNTVTAYHSPLQCAAKQGDLDFVEELIEHGADVNGAPILVAGATALQFAAILGHFEMLRLLLKAGAYVNAPPSPWEGRSAIEGAAEWGRTDTVFLLLELGADIRGRMNVNYRRTVYRAWAHGYRKLAREIQQWKRRVYGQDDCDSIERIIFSMDMDTLGHYGGKYRSIGQACVKCQRYLKSTD